MTDTPTTDPAADPARWITTKEAARILCVTRALIMRERHMGDYNDAAVATRRSISGPGGALEHNRDDIERLRKIMRRTRLKLGQACRVLASLKAEGPL